jgi:hypothetical protein
VVGFTIGSRGKVPGKTCEKIAMMMMTTTTTATTIIIILMLMYIFWVVTPCRFICRHQRFGGTYFLNLPG